MRYVSTVHLRTFSSPTSRYNFIIGRDVLQQGFINDPAHNCVTWGGLLIPMVVDARTKPSSALTITHFITPQAVASQCDQLSQQQQQQQQFSKILQKFPASFSGQLGYYDESKFFLQLQDPLTTPIFSKFYPVPQAHVAVFKAELRHLIDKDVLDHVPCSEWAFPIFIIPEKDGRVRWVSDFRKLNHLLRRPGYFLPRIPQIMQRRKGFRFIAKIDISMDIYMFKTNQQSQKLCEISTPFGLYEYKRLPMSITNSPDFFQSVMHLLFSDIPNVECFIDDIGSFSLDSFSNHLHLLHQVLLRLERNGFSINPLKCE